MHYVSYTAIERCGRLAVSGKYREGLDENGQWTRETGLLALEKSGAIVDLGQVPAWMRKQLNETAKSGALVKYKGYWDTLTTFTGTGPLKDIWALPEVARLAGASRLNEAA